MTEYIEREAAIEAAKHAWAKGLEPSQYIETIPTANVEQVVRCKDCKRRIEKRWCYSLHTYNGEPVGVADDFFCAYGKRKSDG